MEIAPLLFDLRPKRPTTRQVAALVKEGGVSALPDAERRADEARYQEVRCRSALNRVRGMPFEWTLNPYRGCTHGCHYCFARQYQSQLELGAGDDFASVILVKANLVEVLAREVSRPQWARELVAIGTATDPYQPIEGQYRLTRRTLEVLIGARTPAAIVTKGPMIVRDVDLLQQLGAAAGCTVYLSVPTVDEHAWRRLEPGTAHPLQRLRVVKTLVDAGVDAGVLMAPLVPGFSTRPSIIERTVKAIAEHGARFVGSQLMYLEAGTRDHFMRFIAAEFPGMTAQFDELYASKYAPNDYVRRVQEVVGIMKARYGLANRRRTEGEGPVAGPAGPERAGDQGTFDFGAG